jgi:hypothetical protein
LAVVGLLGYRSAGRIAGVAGYRYLSVDYERGGFVWDVSMQGPIVGLRIQF